MSLKGRIAAAYAASTLPNPSAPIVVPARPEPTPAINWRRESSMFMAHSPSPFAPTGDIPYPRPIERVYASVESIFELLRCQTKSAAPQDLVQRSIGALELKALSFLRYGQGRQPTLRQNNSRSAAAQRHSC